ncbi:MAG: hypothetical protein M3Z25_15060 [Actinomycetota bacterium]|nr:hypothetical protein [Actinomycetota bacterium]
MLDLPTPQRIHGVVSSVEYVHQVLIGVENHAREASELGEALREFGTNRLALPQ